MNETSISTNPTKKTMMSSRTNKLISLVVAVAIVVTGGYFLARSFASGVLVSINPQQGTVSGGAQVVTDTTGKQVVQFGSQVATTPPTNPPPSGAWPADNSTGVPHGLPGDTRAPVIAKDAYPANLPKYTGPMNITKAGTVIDGKYIDGALTISAKNVVIKNSYLTLNQGTDTGAHAIMSTDDNANLLVQDSEIDGKNSDSEGGGTFGIGRTGYTLMRVNAHNTGDIIRMDGNGVIQDSWLHDPNGSNGDQHNDVIQSTNATRVRIIHNFLQNFKTQTSCILLKADLGDISDVVVDGNLMAGGGYSFYWMDGKDPNKVVHYIHGGSVTNNHFLRSPQVGSVWPKGGLYGPIDVNAITVPNTWSGNVWDDNNQVINY
jgi:hypothetical protein